MAIVHPANLSPRVISVLFNRQPPAQRGPAGRVPVLPALLPAAAGLGAARGAAGDLEGGVSAAESHCTGIQPASGTTLPPRCGTGKTSN